MTIESSFLDDCSYMDLETVLFGEDFDLNSGTFQSSKEDSVPQKISRRLKELLTFAAVNVLQHCMKSF